MHARPSGLSGVPLNCGADRGHDASRPHQPPVQAARPAPSSPTCGWPAAPAAGAAVAYHASADGRSTEHARPSGQRWCPGRVRRGGYQAEPRPLDGPPHATPDGPAAACTACGGRQASLSWTSTPAPHPLPGILRRRAIRSARALPGRALAVASGPVSRGAPHACCPARRPGKGRSGCDRIRIVRHISQACGPPVQTACVSRGTVRTLGSARRTSLALSLRLRPEVHTAESGARDHPGSRPRNGQPPSAPGTPGDGRPVTRSVRLVDLVDLLVPSFAGPRQPFSVRRTRRAQHERAPTCSTDTAIACAGAVA